MSENALCAWNPVITSANDAVDATVRASRSKGLVSRFRMNLGTRGLRTETSVKSVGSWDRQLGKRS